MAVEIAVRLVRERNSVRRQRIELQIRSRFPEELLHNGVNLIERDIGNIRFIVIDEIFRIRGRLNAELRERVVYGRVGRIGAVLPFAPAILLFFVGPDLAANNLGGLGTFVLQEPGLRAVERVRVDLLIAFLSEFKPSRDQRGQMRRRMFAHSVEPAPASVAVLHGEEFRDAVGGHFAHSVDVKDRLLEPIDAPPLFRALLRVAEFLRVEIRLLLLQFGKVDARVHERFLRYDGRQEPIERLLRAAVRIVRKVGERVENGARERRREPNREFRRFRTAFFRNGQRKGRFANALFAVLFRFVLIGGGYGSGDGELLLDSVFLDGQGILNRVRLFVGERLHHERRDAGRVGAHAPVDARFAVGGRNDRLSRLDAVEERELRGRLFRIVSRKFKRDLDFLLGSEVVVHVRR